MRLKSLPQGWREKQPFGKLDQNGEEGSKDCAGKANSKRMSKSKDSHKSQQYGSFEAILEWTEQGTYRIKEVLQL